MRATEFICECHSLNENLRAWFGKGKGGAEAAVGIVTTPKVNVLVNVAMLKKAKVNLNVFLNQERHH